MPKATKATKKFQKNRLKGVIKKRKETQKKVKQYNYKKSLRDKRLETEAQKKSLKIQQRQQEEDQIDDKDELLSDDEAEIAQDVESFLDSLPDQDSDDLDDDQISSDEEEPELETKQKKKKEVPPKKKKQQKDPNASLKNQVSEHKKQLEELKESDPEFFKFLQEEDAGLLDFNDSDEEGDHMDSDDEDESQSSKKSTKKSGPTELTVELIEELIENVRSTNSTKALKKAVIAYKSACNFADEEEVSRLPYRVTSAEVYNHLMITGVTEFPLLFNQLFEITQEHIDEETLQHEESKTKTKKSRLHTRITKHSRWNNLQACVKSYLTNTVSLLQQSTDVKILNFILKNFDVSFLVYFACMPSLANKLLKVLLTLWSSSEESSRILAFLAIRELTVVTPYPFIDSALKGLYLTFVKNSKFTNRNTLSLVQFMSNCVVELFGLDFKASYEHAFSHIRVLAVKLRNAIIHKTKEHFSMVYGWQFYHSLNVWTEVLCSYSNQQDMQLLVYPLVQVITGVLQLLPAQRYYPYHFLCIRMLHRLTEATKIYIPTLPYLIRTLECPEFSKKLKPSTEKHLDWQCNLKVPNSLLHTRVLFDGVVEQLYELFLEHFYLHAYSISFPELTFPVIMSLRSFNKKTKVPEYAKTFKSLVQQLENATNFVKAHRAKVDYAPKDVEMADNFLADFKDEKATKHPLVKFYNQQQQVRKKTQKSDEVGEIFEMED